MTEDHPAMIAARGSLKAAQAGDKDAWLDLMADDVLVELIGVAPTNPSARAWLARRNSAPSSTPTSGPTT